MAILILLAKIGLGFAIVVLTLYAARHYGMTLYRLSLRRPRDTNELVGFRLPRISVLVPMHNEEGVARDVLRALVECDYDHKLLEIIAIDDRSTDNTGLLIDDFAAEHPIIKVIHRTKGAGGKGAALIEATQQATGEILLMFDADYFPGRAMLQMLVSPFCDPEIGAVMGRVVPHNTGGSLLAALLGLERAAGYQVSQQARYNLGLTPQFGGTVGGVRVSALKSVGGWNEKSLTEDTDLTFRMAAQGWRIGYVNRAECYEEAPESWTVRERQIVRWAMGHTDCLHRLGSNILSSRLMTKLEKVDAIFVLCCYFTAPVLVFGWLCSLVLLFSPQAHQVPAFAVALALVGYQLFGSQATFFEMGAAAVLDGKTRPADLVPLNLFNFFASTGAICKALYKYYSDRFFGTKSGWDKTKRFRENGFPNGNGNGNGHGNGNGNGNGNGHPRPRLYTQGANGLYTCGLEEHRP